jgi:diguanylate cyclase (GGDEF)-like protein/PAS domain S-box-containing protein
VRASIRTKAVLSLIVVAAICAPVMLLCLRAILLPKFRSLDVDQAERDMVRLVQALHGEEEPLAVFCNDWAQWDDTYDFVATRNPGYIESNLQSSTFVDSKLDAIAVYDTEGRLVWGQLWDLVAGEPLQGTDTDEPMPSFLGFVGEGAPEGASAGLVRTQWGLMFVAYEPVLHSDNSGPPRGTLLMARRLSEGLFTTVAKRAQVDGEMQPAGAEPGSPSDAGEAQSVPVWPSAWVAVSGVLPDRVETIASVPDIAGHPCLDLAAETPRTASVAGRDAVAMASMAAAIVILMSAVGVGLALHRTALVRISKLGRQVGDIGGSYDLGRRVDVEGADELTEFAVAVNAMLASLEEAQIALRASQARMAAMFNTAAVGAAIIDPTMSYAFVNDRWGAMLGYSPDDLAGRDVGDFSHPDDAELVAERRRALVAGEITAFRDELRYIRADGELLWADVSACAIGDDGRMDAVIAVYVDITDRKRAEAELRMQSLRDPLTSLPNRRAFDEHLDREWRRAMRHSLPVSLLMIDIDHFKLYNDTYGHQAGDDCLKQVSRVLEDTLGRATEFVARWGGEEFVVIIAGDLAQAAESGARIREALIEARLARPGHDPACVTVSVGAASSTPALGAARDDLLEAADRALYAAKQGGRNRVATAET